MSKIESKLQVLSKDVFYFLNSNLNQLSKHTSDMTLEEGNDIVSEQKIMKCSILKSQYELKVVYEEN